MLHSSQSLMRQLTRRPPQHDLGSFALEVAQLARRHPAMLIASGMFIVCGVAGLLAARHFRRARAANAADDLDASDAAEDDLDAADEVRLETDGGADAISYNAAADADARYDGEDDYAAATEGDGTGESGDEVDPTRAMPGESSTESARATSSPTLAPAGVQTGHWRARH